MGGVVVVLEGSCVESRVYKIPVSVSDQFESLVVMRTGLNEVGTTAGLFPQPCRNFRVSGVPLALIVSKLEHVH